MFGLPSIQECVPDGGVFALLIPPIAAFLLGIETLWLLIIATRALKRRADLLKVRDLLIEGSIGQAILLSDRRQNDDVLAVCRAGIVAVQSNGDRGQASDRIAQEAGFRFAQTLATKARLVALGIMIAIPIGFAFAGRAYAERLAITAASEFPEEQRAAVLAEVRADPPFACPFTLGFAGALVLAFPAAAIAFLESARRSKATRARAVSQAEMFADMASVVINPTSRAYRDERR